MKTIRTLLLLSLTLLFLSCSDDKDDDKKGTVNLGELKQTSWEGRLMQGRPNDPGSRRANLGIVFVTSARGSYTLKYDGFDDIYAGEMTYTVDERLLRIEHGNLTISGDWLLVESTKHSMKLVQGTDANPEIKLTMILERAD